MIASTSHGYVVGIDLGGTKIRGGLATADGSIIADRTVRTTPGGADVAAQIVALVRGLGADAGVSADAIMATGVGGAGVPDLATTGFTRAPNLSSLRDTGLGSALSRALGHRVVLENDVNAAALGELHYGVGLTESTFVFISVGTGVGMGIVDEGRLIRGAHGGAGEIGHLPVGTDPLDAANHRRGALEEALAGDVIVERYREATGRPLTAEQIFDRAGSGDTDALAAIDAEARWLAFGIAAVAAVLDPGVVVLGGGIGSRSELLERLHPWLAALGTADLDVRMSVLGHNAPVAGAVRLALDAVSLDPRGLTR